jgi:hypothetical protein
MNDRKHAELRLAKAPSNLRLWGRDHKSDRTLSCDTGFASLIRRSEQIERMPTHLQAASYSAAMHYLKAVQAAGTDETGAS